jgi:hypothetical protein
MYDAVSRFVKLSDKLLQLCEKLQLPKFSRAEVEFMKEYAKTMEPLACCLDTLQGDSNCFYGMLLPKLIQLRNKLRKMICDNLQYCSPLVNALFSGIGTRFGNLLAMDLSDMTAKESVLAAICHPHYKLKWVPPEKREEFSQFFVDTVVRLEYFTHVYVLTYIYMHWHL